MSLVSIEDGVKAAEEYAPARKVRVEIAFDVPEGGDTQKELDRAAAIADAKVNELLGRGAAKNAVVAPATPASTVAAGQPQPEAPKRAPGRPKKTDKDKLAEAAGVKVPEQTDIEDAILNADADPGTIGALAKTPPTEDDDLLSAPEPEITDQALVDAIMHRNGELKAEGCTTSNVKIREVIGSFNPDPSRLQFTAKEIKQEHRADFLAKLKALKAT